MSTASAAVDGPHDRWAEWASCAMCLDSISVEPTNSSAARRGTGLRGGGRRKATATCGAATETRCDLCRRRFCHDCASVATEVQSHQSGDGTDTRDTVCCALCWGASSLYDLVQQRRLGKVRELLRTGIASPLAPTRDGRRGWSALHVAASMNDIEALQTLLAFHAPTYGLRCLPAVAFCRDDLRDTSPLDIALEQHRVEAAYILYHSGDTHASEVEGLVGAVRDELDKPEDASDVDAEGAVEEVKRLRALFRTQSEGAKAARRTRTADEPACMSADASCVLARRRSAMDNDRGCRDLSAGAEKVRVPCVLPPGGSVDQAPSLIYITRSVASSSCTSEMGLDLTATITPVQCTVLVHAPSGVVGGGTNGSARLFSIHDSREPMDGGSGREMTHASSPQRISAMSSVAPPFKGLRQNLKVVGTENGRGFGLYNAGELIKKGEYIGEVRTSIVYRFTCELLDRVVSFDLLLPSCIIVLHVHVFATVKLPPYNRLLDPSLFFIPLLFIHTLRLSRSMLASRFLHPSLIRQKRMLHFPTRRAG